MLLDMTWAVHFRVGLRLNKGTAMLFSVHEHVTRLQRLRKVHSLSQFADSPLFTCDLDHVMMWDNNTAFEIGFSARQMDLLMHRQCQQVSFIYGRLLVELHDDIVKPAPRERYCAWRARQLMGLICDIISLDGNEMLTKNLISISTQINL